MENISGVNYAQNVQSIQQPSFQGRRKEEYYVSQPIEQKEDGDKKLWCTLAAIGATAAPGIYIAKGKSGPAKAIRNGVKNLFGKGAKEAAEKTAKKGSKEAIEQSKKVIKGISTETQENINKLTNGVTDVLTNQKAYDEQQNIVRNLQAKVTAYQDAITAARNASQNFVEVDGRKINLSKAEGWLGGFKGELRTAQATLDKMTKPSDDALSNAVKAVQEANTGEGAAIIQCNVRQENILAYQTVPEKKSQKQHNQNHQPKLTF